MPAWTHHVFVCQNTRPPGHPKGSCGQRGAQELVFALQEAREEHGLWETLKVNTTNCLGPCRAGAIVGVYPEGVFYSGVTADDVPEIVKSHFVDGRPVERLILPE